MRHNVPVFIVAASSLLFGSCKTTSRSHSKLNNDGGNDILLTTAQLGQAYDSGSGRFLATTCITDVNSHIKTINPPNVGEFTFTNNTTFGKLVDYLKQHVEGEVAVKNAGITVKGNLDFTTDSANNEFRSTIYIGQTVSGGLAEIESFKVKANETPADLKTGSESVIRARCGDQFLKSVELTASLAMTITFDFKNKTDKEKFDASGSIKWVEQDSKGSALKNGTDLEVKGEINRNIEKYTDSALVTIRILQRGGDATQIAQAVDAKSVITCGAENKDACTAAVTKFVDYAVNWPKQFTDSKGDIQYKRFALASPIFASYDSIYEGAMIQPLQAPLQEAIRTKRKLMITQMLNERALFTRLESLVNSPIVNDAKRRDLTEIMEKISDRILVLARAYQVCAEVDSTLVKQQRCLGDVAFVEGALKPDADLKSGGAIEAAKKVLSQPEYQYDETKLILTAANFKEYCTLFKTWHDVANMENGNGVSRAESLMDTDKRLSYLMFRFQSEMAPALSEAKAASLTSAMNYFEGSESAPDPIKSELDIFLKCRSSDYLKSNSVKEVSNGNFKDLQFRDLTAVGMFPNLTKATFNNLNVLALDSFWPLERLSEIYIYDSALNALAIKDLARKPGLVKLTLDNSLDLVDEKVGNFLKRKDPSEYLSNMPNLTELNLSKNKNVFELEKMKGLTSLRVLWLVNTKLAESSLCRGKIAELKKNSPNLDTVYIDPKDESNCFVEGIKFSAP